MTNAIKWTLGRPPESREGQRYLCFVRSRLRISSLDILESDEDVSQVGDVIAHALINYPLTINEAVTYDEPTNSWVCWDINGMAFHTGLASREEAEAAYRDEYGDW